MALYLGVDATTLSHRAQWWWETYSRLDVHGLQTDLFT